MGVDISFLTGFSILFSSVVFAEATYKKIDKETFRDPTQPINASVNERMKKDTNFILQGIFKSENNTVDKAIINGIILHAGDYIGGWRVHLINRYSVSLVRGEDRKKMYIQKKIVRNKER